MNKLKVKSKNGTVSYIKLMQHRDIRKFPFFGQEWESPKQAKARVYRMNGTLLGVRQS